MERYIDWLNERIAANPRTVIALFVVATLVFTTGLGAIETESGQEQFIEDLPSYKTFEDVQRDFGDRFDSGPTTATTLLQHDRNALSKPALLQSLRAQNRIEENDA